MEPNKNYFLVGLFIIIGFLALAGFSMWITDRAEKHVYVYYQIPFNESVSGLSNGSPVKFRGVAIGSVTGINIDLNRADTIVAHIRVLKGTPVRKDTFATLKIQGITGASFIELSGGDVTQEKIEGSKRDNENVPEIPSRVSNIATISNEAPQLIDRASHLVAQADKMLNDETIAHFQGIIRHWDSIFESLDKETAKLDQIISSIDHLTATADKVMTDIDAAKFGDTLKNMHEASAQLKGFAAQANKSTSAGIEEFTKLMQDARKTSHELRSFTRSLKENPSQVLFPTQDKQEKLP